MMYIRLQVGDFYSKIHSYSQEKNEIMPYVATWMDLDIIIQGEVSQANIIDNAYMWNLKKRDTNELIYKTKT